MAASRWATISVPRRATFDTTRDEPSDYLIALLRQALRQGLPARRPAGPVMAWLGRHDFPGPPLAGVLRRMPARPDDALDALLRRLAEAWPQLAARSRALPDQPPQLTALAIQRSAARTVFVFDRRLPLLVVKQPSGSRDGALAEVAALRGAEPADVAPRFLADLDGDLVQEGLPGEPLQVEPVTPGTAHALASGGSFPELGQALARLAAATAHTGPLDHQLHRPVDAALRSGLLSEAARRGVTAAQADLAQLDVAVLQHRDLSAQNWLVGSTGFVGLVDWETAVEHGVPGFDALHAGVSLLEHGVGLVRWSEERVMQSFTGAWTSAPLFDDVREAFHRSARAAAVPDRLLEPLQVAFFARRLGRRIQKPEGHAVGARTAARMLELVCGS